MPINETTKRWLWGSFLPLLCMGLVVYFGSYGLYGQQGLITLVKTHHELELKRIELAELEGQRDAMARRVLNMRPERLDPDLLDEQARATLGYTAPGEITVLDEAR